MAKFGLKIIDGYAPTGFWAELDTGRKGPVVAILCPFVGFMVPGDHFRKPGQVESEVEESSIARPVEMVRRLSRYRSDDASPLLVLALEQVEDRASGHPGGHGIRFLRQINSLRGSFPMFDGFVLECVCSFYPRFLDQFHCRGSGVGHGYNHGHYGMRSGIKRPG